MLRTLARLVALVTLVAGIASAAGIDVKIKSPADGDKVGERPIVSGVVSDPRAKVWVVVHPMEADEFWVQPEVTIRDGGAWSVQIYIGRPGNIDVGKRFEVRAGANPKKPIKEGQTDRWPEFETTSNVVEISRQ